MVPLVGLGKSGLEVSRVAFGAGPVSNLLTDSADHPTDLQVATIQHAVELGINWFDTAATYADGKSETILGSVLSRLKPQRPIQLATKVRIGPEETGEIRDAILRSVEGSLKRLRVSSLALLQLHNSVTSRRGDLPTSLTIDDLFEPQGVLDTFRELKDQGVIRAAGLTGIGDANLLCQAVRSDEFDTIQVPCHLLNPSAIRPAMIPCQDTDYGEIMAHASERRMGTFAIRVLAGGALAGHAASPHTHKTKFFPLDLYERDKQVAAALARTLNIDGSIEELALHYIFSSQYVNSAIIGFGTPEQVDEAVRIAQTPALTPEEIESLEAAVFTQYL